MRPILRKRFYQACRDRAGGAAFAVLLDGKPVRTPAGRPLAAPTLALAEALAAEWDAQHDVIDPGTMPLTRLANSIIDGVASAPHRSPRRSRDISASDLVCYRAELAARARRASDARVGSDRRLGARCSRRAFRCSPKASCT